jgi:UDP-N-acetylmuramate: L-alanyl-gamma-D-glutamyl-meso-diaminopimelate ligase
VELARARSRAPVHTYGIGGPAAEYHASDATFGAEGARFKVRGPGGDTASLWLPLSGLHNVENATGVYAAARQLGVPPALIARGFAGFKGVKRRQEPRGEIGGVLVIDDFAHHPTAVRETIDGIRGRYPGRRLWAVFEPRSNTSRRNIHQQAYAEAFHRAHLVTMRLPEPHDQVPADQQLDVPAIVEVLRARGIEATCSSDVAELVRIVSGGARREDVILVMSNGSFGGFIPSLLSALRGGEP